MTRAKKGQRMEPTRVTFATNSIAAYDQPLGGDGTNSAESGPQPLSYDENLLEHCRTRWQLGDWGGLTAISLNSLQHHPDKAKLALLVAAGHSQASNAVAAKQFIRAAQKWGCSKRLISQVLISGVLTRLGRAALASGQSDRAMGHFTASAFVLAPFGDSTQVGEDIAAREMSRMDKSSHAAGPLRAATAAAPHIWARPSVGITSYAQNFEDVMLWRALGKVGNGFYVDVGAQDPVADSVSKAFYDHGWRGIHVEPVAEYAQALRQARPYDEVIEAMLTTDASEHIFYKIPKTGISTGAKKFADRHKQSGWEVLELTVAGVTLAEVFDRAGQRDIHWLKVDVEGMEDDVLKGWSKHVARPWVVVVEATEPLSETPNWDRWEHHLLDRDYSFVYFDGLNRFYVSAQHRDLMHAFQTPPNVFDGFRK